MRICRYYSIDDPTKAGAVSMEALCEMGRQYRHLIPCGALKWNWTYRTMCMGCEGNPLQVSYNPRLLKRAMRQK